jgi:hypothetical protein
VLGDKTVIKIGVQLYKVKAFRYLLDIKKFEGHSFVFFDIVTKLLANIKL